MKNLARRTNRYLAAFIAMLFLTLLLVGSFTLAVYRIDTASNDYRQSLSLVNSLISELNRIRSLEMPERSYTILEERLERMLESRAVKKGGPALSGNIETMPQRLREGSISFSQAIQESGAIARALSDGFHKRRDSLNLFASLAIIINLAVIFLLLAITLLLRKSTCDFFLQIQNGLSLMQKVINFEIDRTELRTPQWEEEELLKHTVEKLTGQIERDQELREMELNSQLDSLLPRISHFMDGKIPYDRISVAFIDINGIVMAEAAVSLLEKVVLEPGFTEHIGQTTLSSVIMRREPRILNDLEQHYREKNQSASTGKLLEEGIRSSITVPLFFENRCVGFFFVSSRNKNAYNRNHAFFARKIAYSIKQHIYYTFVLQQTIAETARAFIKLTEKKDNETSLHIVRMAQYSHLLALQLFNSGAYEIRPRFIREILWFAPLHDIGKIGIPDSILLKPGPLSPDEWAVMETHVSIGEEVLRSMDRGIRNTTNSSHLLTAIDITGSHHEKWDGSGYPRGLQGESIPLAGRIVALADVFDALTSRRPYKEPFSPEQAVEIIRSGKGSHFDPLVVEAFEAAFPEFMRVYGSHKEI